MRNFILSIVLTTMLVSFFSFTNRNGHIITEQSDEEEDGGYIADTVPHKKDTSLKKNKTQPYDSFGKPKKMDSATH